jgi:hypothetical protein
VAAVVGGNGEGLAATLGEGLAIAAEGLVLPQLTPSKATAAVAAETRSFDCMGMLLNTLPRTHADTGSGYDQSYSGVTYAALRPPSTRNVAPFT